MLVRPNLVPLPFAVVFVLALSSGAWAKKGGEAIVVEKEYFGVHYDKVKVGDRIEVEYSEDKHTNAVWTAEIED
jgi:hypothetical protein